MVTAKLTYNDIAHNNVFMLIDLTKYVLNKVTILELRKHHH